MAVILLSLLHKTLTLVNCFAPRIIDGEPSSRIINSVIVIYRKFDFLKTRNTGNTLDEISLTR